MTELRYFRFTFIPKIGIKLPKKRGYFLLYVDRRG